MKKTALRLAQEQPPDLILPDMILRKVSGKEVLRRWNRGRVTAKIPVVVLSSILEKNRQKLLEAGAEEYPEKNSLMPTD